MSKTINYDPTGKARDFEDCFGFDYKDYKNTYDVAMALKEVQGFDCDLLNATRDETGYLYNDKLIYEFDEECSIISKMKQELKDRYGCEEFKTCVAGYEVSGIWISAFSADVYAEKDGIEYCYSTYFFMNSWPE